jgi:hypothetical protein
MYSTIRGDLPFPAWLRDFREVWKEHGFGTAWSWNFWRVTRGSGSVLFGFYPYEEHTVIQYTVYPLYRVLLARQDAVRWFKYRFLKIHMHHIVFTGLEPGWHDKDNVMLHACFKLLTDFVEKEHYGAEALQKFTNELKAESNPHAPPEQIKNQCDRQKEILALYHWWTVQRPSDLKLCDEQLHQLYGKDFSFKLKANEEVEQKRQEHDDFEAKIEADEQVMLHRLIDIRQSLWT